MVVKLFPSDAAPSTREPPSLPLPWPSWLLNTHEHLNQVLLPLNTLSWNPYTPTPNWVRSSVLWDCTKPNEHFFIPALVKPTTMVIIWCVIITLRLWVSWGQGLCPSVLSSVEPKIPLCLTDSRGLVNSLLKVLQTRPLSLLFRCGKKRGHILNLTISGEAYIVRSYRLSGGK